MSNSKNSCVNPAVQLQTETEGGFENVCFTCV